MARPMPDPAPVTTAIFPSSWPMIDTLLIVSVPYTRHWRSCRRSSWSPRLLRALEPG